MNKFYYDNQYIKAFSLLKDNFKDRTFTNREYNTLYEAMRPARPMYPLYSKDYSQKQWDAMVNRFYDAMSEYSKSYRQMPIGLSALRKHNFVTVDHVEYLKEFEVPIKPSWRTGWYDYIWSFHGLEINQMQYNELPADKQAECEKITTKKIQLKRYHYKVNFDAIEKYLRDREEAHQYVDQIWCGQS